LHRRASKGCFTSFVSRLWLRHEVVPRSEPLHRVLSHEQTRVGSGDCGRAAQVDSAPGSCFFFFRHSIDLDWYVRWLSRVSPLGSAADLPLEALTRYAYRGRCMDRDRGSFSLAVSRGGLNASARRNVSRDSVFLLAGGSAVAKRAVGERGRWPVSVARVFASFEDGMRRHPGGRTCTLPASFLLVATKGMAVGCRVREFVRGAAQSRGLSRTESSVFNNARDRARRLPRASVPAAMALRIRWCAVRLCPRGYQLVRVAGVLFVAAQPVAPVK